jgi:hypothetical protein
MAGQGSHSTDRAVEDLWRRTLDNVPTLYGRLVYLSSLRNPNSNRYEHHGLATRFGEPVADRILRASHEEVFQEWLAAGLPEQKADLDRYLSSLDDSRRLIIETWMRVSPYKALVPASARAVEIDLFQADFRFLMEALKNEYGAAEPDLGA